MDDQIPSEQEEFDLLREEQVYAFSDDLYKFVMDHDEQNLHTIILGISNVAAQLLCRMPPDRVSAHLSYLFTALADCQAEHTQDLLQKVATIVGTEGNG